MKKVLFLLVMAFALTSCDEWWEEENSNNDVQWNIETFTIKPHEWKRMQSNDNRYDVYYICEVMPELYTQLNKDERFFIYEEGNVFGYVYLDYNMTTEAQQPLPYVLNYSNRVGESQVRTYYMEFTPNAIYFYAAFSGTDYLDSGAPNEDLTFRVVMNW